MSAPHPGAGRGASPPDPPEYFAQDEGRAAAR